MANDFAKFNSVYPISISKIGIPPITIYKKIKYYKQNAGCSNITLNDKMRLATIDDVCYVKQSTLIPHELKLEVQVFQFNVPPVVMSHCLLLAHYLY
jgi:hypothetical protein